MGLKLNRVEIDHHTIKLIIGVIAISLAMLTSAFSHTQLESISASYHEGGSPRNIFVGFLFAISAFFLAYNGRSPFEMVLSKMVAFAAIGVAMFPCTGKDNQGVIPHIHYISATIMFLLLVAFCYSFYKRAHGKGHAQAICRAYIYVTSGIVIMVSIAIIALDCILGGPIRSKFNRLVFFCETAALISFGVAWLTASRILPLITRKDERLSISPFQKSNT